MTAPVLGGRGRFRVHPLILTGVAPLFPMLIGSAINIWYNVTNVDPMLTPRQRAIFLRTISLYNLIMNVFLTEMVDVIEQRHGGIVNKFLGDGLMAMFAGWTGRVDHADAAVSAGREMLERLQAINARLGDAGEPPLAIGIGIHTGRAVVGSIGSPRRMEYTAIGDTVNVASHVESLTKIVGAPLLLTDATQQALQMRVPLELLPAQQVKGHTPVDVLKLVER